MKTERLPVFQLEAGSTGKRETPRYWLIVLLIICFYSGKEQSSFPLLTISIYSDNWLVWR